MLLNLSLEVTTWLQLGLSARELGTTAMRRLQISYVNATSSSQIQQGKPGYIPGSCDCGGPGLENSCHRKGCHQESPHFHTNNKTEGEVFMTSPRCLLLHSLFQLLITIKCRITCDARAQQIETFLLTTA